MNPPQAAEELFPEQTRIKIRKAETPLGNTVQEAMAAVRCEPETLTPNAEVGRRTDSAACQKMSSISNGIPLEDLGPSSNSSDDEDLILSSKNPFQPKSESIVRQMGSGEEKGSRQVSLTPVQGHMPISSLANDPPRG